jgi:hypothetical protein
LIKEIPSMRQRYSVFILPALSAVLLTCAGLVVHSFPVLAAPPAATSQTTAVVTDQAKLTLSNRFAMPPSQVRLTDAGDVLFTSQGSSEPLPLGWGGADAAPPGE